MLLVLLLLPRVSGVCFALSSLPPFSILSFSCRLLPPLPLPDHPAEVEAAQENDSEDWDSELGVSGQRAQLALEAADVQYLVEKKPKGSAGGEGPKLSRGPSFRSPVPIAPSPSPGSPAPTKPKRAKPSRVNSSSNVAAEAASALPVAPSAVIAEVDEKEGKVSWFVESRNTRNESKANAAMILLFCFYLLLTFSVKVLSQSWQCTESLNSSSQPSLSLQVETVKSSSFSSCFVFFCQWW